MSTIFHLVSGLVNFSPKSSCAKRIQKLYEFLPVVDDQSSIQNLGVVVRGMIVSKLFSFYISQQKFKTAVNFESHDFVFQNLLKNGMDKRLKILL